MDAIFKALSDPTRRALLDALRERDGQTLSDLEMTTELSRFGVMKHLGVLEAASLITTRKVGRFKHHYLNAIALQEVVDRWIEPIVARGLARSVLNIKHSLEEGSGTMSANPDFQMETYIRTTPETLWKALTSQDISARYNTLAGGIVSDFKTGSDYHHVLPDGSTILSGQILEADAPNRLDMTFVPGWAGPDAPASRALYEIAQHGELCRLRVCHFDIPEGQEGVCDGWVKILSNLKSLLETGQTLAFSQEDAA